MKLLTRGAFSPRHLSNVFWVIALIWSTQTGLTDAANETVCKRIDIRNQVSDFSQLEGCTVIEGSLQILLIDYAEPSDYEGLSFPLLREITDYLLLYRVYGLRSLAKIFPNLSVIRGQKLFFNYALVAFEMMSLEDIALPSLTTIMRGGVRLEKNSDLCYYDNPTIDWSRIVTSVEDNFIMQNKALDECVNLCPKNAKGEDLCKTKNKLPGGKALPLCWNSEHCQLVCPDNCGTKACYRSHSGTDCCHDNCVGGCTGPTTSDCTACRDFFYDGRCLERCPPDTYIYMNRRCITERECQDMDKEVSWKLFKNKKMGRNECIEECPSGFTTDDHDKHKCKPCEGPCPRTCNPVPVDSVAAAQKLKGCTVIKGFLQIHITGGNRVGYELEHNLGEIQIVDQYIKIMRSAAISSLHFLRQLRIIKGDALYNDRYALFVLDNQNLQEIWDWKVHPNLTIIQGVVFFNQNRKLCLDKIYELVDRVGIKRDQVDDVDISRINNGDQAACNMTTLSLRVMQVQDSVVIISWSNFKADDGRKLLHYVVYYREAPEQNITIWNARDACSTDVWKTKDVPPGDAEQDNLAEIIYDLKPFTQYAMYVQTYTIASAQQGAISPIIYFSTKPAVPTNPRKVGVEAKSPSELIVTWEPPSRPNGNVTHYYVYWQAQQLNQDRLDQRNYCDDKLHLSSPVDKHEEEDQTKTNVTYDGKFCCRCPMTEKEVTDSENDRKFQIMFEDFLHDTVYIKRPATMNGHGDELASESPSTTHLPERYRRDVGGMHYQGLAAQAGINSSSILSNLSLPNITTNMSEPQYGAHQPYLAAVVYGKTTITLPDLRHFTEYSIEVIACHEVVDGETEKRCSNRAITTGRTLPLDGADNIHHNNVTIEEKDGDVVITWPDPHSPNGLIVTYELKYEQLGKDFQPVVLCITHMQYREMRGYRLSKLNYGNYSLMLRATSLAGNGSWTEPKYFYIPSRIVGPALNTELIAAIAASSAFIAVLLVSMLVWYFAKKHFNATPESLLYSSFNPDYLTVYVPDTWEVSREDVKIGKELGQGSFGMVYEGFAKNLLSSKDEVKVAIKTVMEGATQRDRMEFLNEASVMKAFDCNHVVKLLGVVSKGSPTLVIMELMANGDLKNYLRMHRPDAEDNNGRSPPTLKEILKIAGEICDGMVYLSSKKFVHRDLAARNCMVDCDGTVKIGDFGMTRDVYETDYYKKGGKGLLPVRWMAPESLRDGRFTSQSDVWSYGVVLWEMATLAAQPYQGLSNEQVLNYVKDGGIMEKPVGCPDRLYNIMLLCWRHNERDRPTFCEILESLVPDLDEGFKDCAYFFSEENQHDRENARTRREHGVSHIPSAMPPQEDEEEDDDEEESLHGINDSHTPLTGSSQELHRHRDSPASQPPSESLRLFKHSQTPSYPYKPQNSAYNSHGSAHNPHSSAHNPHSSAHNPHSSAHNPHSSSNYSGPRTLNSGYNSASSSLTFPHSSTSYQPYTSSLHQPAAHSPPDSSTATQGGQGPHSVPRTQPPSAAPVGVPSAVPGPASGVHSSRTSSPPPPLPPPPSNTQRAESISRSPSTDDSKESSKSSGSYVPVNGMANGHLPRAAKC